MKKMIFTLKRQALVLILLCCTISMTAADLVTITVDSRDPVNTGTVGFSNLEQALIAAGYNTPEKIAGITDLKVITSGQYQNTTGTSAYYNIALEANDFIYLNSLTTLINLDLSESVVTANNYTNRGEDNSIPSNAFLNNGSIKSITLPETLKGISTGAFVRCSLEGLVSIPVGVNGGANVDNTRFGDSQGITGFIADENSTTISTDNGVVFDKYKTTLHYYPCGKPGTFYVIPEGVEIIRNSAFEWNNNLKNITFASTTTSIHTAGAVNYTAIATQSKIDSIFVVDGNTQWSSVNGLLYENASNKLVWSPRGRTEVKIMSPIREIAGGGGQNAIFGGNATNTFGGVSVSNNYASVITLIDIPATVETIYNGAFVGTANMNTVICRATDVPVNYPSSFNNMGGNIGWNVNLYVPAASLPAYKSSSWVTDTKWINPDNPSGGEVNFKGFNLNKMFPFYNINMTAGTASSPIATDIAAEAQTVSITAATAPAGKVFDKWVTTGITLANETEETASFTMPANDVTLEATYKNDPTTGIGSTENDKLALYPNPATDYIQLSGANNTSYTIYSVVGSAVVKGVTNGETISVSGLPSGIYIFKAEGKAIQFIKK